MNRPKWVELYELARAYAQVLCDGKVLAKFELSFTSRHKTGAYANACWGALKDVKLKSAADRVKELFESCPVRGKPGETLEIDMANTSLSPEKSAPAKAPTATSNPGRRAKAKQPAKPAKQSRTRAKRS